MGSDESSLDFFPELKGKIIRGENSPISISMSGPRIPRTLSVGRLREAWFRHDLEYTPAGPVLSRRVVTDAGVAFMTNDWLANATDITNFNAHANGTGTTAEAVGNTALVTEVGTRVAGSKTRPTNPQLQTVATISQGATQAITEHGLFDSTSTTGSTLWDRSVFAALNVANGDSIQFTYTVTINSGG